MLVVANYSSSLRAVTLARQIVLQYRIPSANDAAQPPCYQKRQSGRSDRVNSVGQ